MEQEPRIRTPLAAFLVVLVAPLAFLLLMVPGLLAGSVSKLHLKPPALHTPALPFIPGGAIPGGSLPGGAAAQNPPVVILPSPAASPLGPAAPTAGAAPAIVLTAAFGPAPGAVTTATTSKHNKRHHNGHFHPADSDLHGQGS